MSSFFAGADVRSITPPVGDGAPPVFLAGFQGNRRATLVDDQLCVRTMAIREGGRAFVLTVCDLIGLVRDDTLVIRRAVTDLDVDVVVASTHTHSGPDTIGLWGPDERTRGVDEPWMAQVRSTVSDSIRAAMARLEPASVRIATTTVEGVIANYRDPRIVDAQVGALAVDRLASPRSAIATLANVGCHPEVLDGDSTLVSPDMAGACARAMQITRGGVGIWVSGDLGGMQSPAEGPRTAEEATRKGQACARAALEALRNALPVADPVVRFRTDVVRLPLWNPRYREGIATGLLPGTIRDEGCIEADVGVLELGPSRWACWPGEILPALGLRSKELLRTDHPFLIGLANDELGYILPEEDFIEPSDWDDPGPQYEESMSVGPRTGPLLMAALQRMVGPATRGTPSKEQEP